MPNYSVKCVIEGDNSITQEIVADSPLEAVDRVGKVLPGKELIAFNSGHITELVQKDKIIKFIVTDLDEEEKIRAEQAEAFRKLRL